MNIKIFLIAFWGIASHSLAAQVNKQAPLIIIENKGVLTYTDKIVAIPWKAIKGKYPSIDTANLTIINAVTLKEMDYQLEFAGRKEVQNLLVQITLKPNSTVSFYCKHGKHRLFTIKTYGRFVPERKEDFAWENDKIAFRMYGKELENTPKENAYGIDVWVKRTSKMVINNRYKRGEYHVDYGDGLDYYGVGHTLGAGNLMPYLQDSIWYSKNYTKWEILDSGPLRTTFKLAYDAWDVGGIKISATKIITLDAGSQLNKVSVWYTYEGTAGVPVVIGIAKRTAPGIQMLNEKEGILGYWEPEHGKDGITGVGIIVPSAIKAMQVNDKQLLAFSQLLKDQPFVYYTGAVWNKAGFILNADQWFDYLKKMRVQLLNNDLEIK